jgi:hypothetical protein
MTRCVGVDVIKCKQRRHRHSKNNEARQEKRMVSSSPRSWPGSWIEAPKMVLVYRHAHQWIKTEARQLKKYMVGFNLVSDRRA